MIERMSGHKVAEGYPEKLTPVLARQPHQQAENNYPVSLPIQYLFAAIPVGSPRGRSA
jgi:hypothetical protein